jgi:hypothetical protein
VTMTYVPVINTQRNVAFGQNLDVAGSVAGSRMPHTQGLLAWTDVPTSIGTGTAGIAGTLNLSALYIPADSPCTRLFWGNNAGGVTPTAGQNFVSVINSAGVVLASVNVDAKVANTGIQTETLALSLTAGMYWVGFLFNAATLPSVYRTGPLNGTLNNLGIALPQQYVAAKNGTGLTAMPASIDPTQNVAQVPYFFAALAA